MFRLLGVRAGICRADLEAGLTGFAGVDIVWARWDVGVAIPAQFIEQSVLGVLDKVATFGIGHSHQIILYTDCFD